MAQGQTNRPIKNIRNFKKKKMNETLQSTGKRPAMDQMVLGQLDTHMKKRKKLGSLFHPIPKSKYKVDYKPKSEKQNNKYLSRQSRKRSSR